MATTTNTHPITVEQYENSFEGWPGLGDELINGRIVMNPSPKPLHQHVVQNVMLVLMAVCESSAYTVYTNAGVRFRSQNSELGPDVFVVAREAMEKAIATDDYLDTPPVLVVEVALSESGHPQRIGDKVQIYLSAGIAAVWVVEPHKFLVTIHRSSGKTVCTKDWTASLPSPLKGSVKVADFFAGVPEK